MAKSQDCSFLPPPRILTRGGWFFLSVLFLTFFSAWVQADTITIPGSDTGQSYSLADDGNTPAVTNLSGDNTLTGTLTFTGDSTFKVDTGSTLKVNTIAQNEVYTLIKTGGGELRLTNRTLIKSLTVKDGTITLTGNQYGGLLLNSVIQVIGETAVLNAANTALGYTGKNGNKANGTLYLTNGGTLKNSEENNRNNIGYTVYMNNGIITSVGEGDSFGSFILDTPIYVQSGTDNRFEAVKITTRNYNSSLPADACGGVFDVAQNAKLTVTPRIMGSNVPLIKDGAGELVLTGVSTYTQATNVNAGKLILSGAGNLTGTNGVTVASGATLEFTNSNSDGEGGAVTFDRTISGAGNLVKSGTGTLTLSGANTYTGGTTITAGTLKLTNSSTMGTGTATVASGAMVEIETASNSTWTWSGGVINGAGTLKVTGSGELSMPLEKMQINTNGSLIVDGAKLTLTNPTTNYPGKNIYINNGGTLAFDRTTDAYAGIYFNNTLNVYFDQNGGGTLNTGDKGNSYMNLISNSQITFTTNGGATNYITGTNGFNTHHYNLNFDVAKGTAASGVDLEVSANLWNTKGIVKNGAGTMALTYDNTYTGGTTINAGTLKLVGAGSTGTGTVTVNDNGTLEYNVAEGVTKTLTLTAQNAIFSTGKIIKTGAGELKIDAADPGSIDAQSFVISSGRVDIKTYFDGQLEVKSGATFSPGNSVGPLTIDSQGVVVIGESTYGDGFILNEEGSKLLMEIGGSDVTDNDVLIVQNGNILLGNGIIELAMTDDCPLGLGESFTAVLSAENSNGLDVLGHIQTSDFTDLKYELISDATYGNVYAITGRRFNANEIPEPSTWALLLLGAAGLLYVRKRNK